MDKKTLSNLELELTQKIQLHFPRGVIPVEVLKYWSNCPADVLRIILLDAFFTLETLNEEYPVVKVKRNIPLKLPQNGYVEAKLYFPQKITSNRHEEFHISEVIPWFPILLGNSISLRDIIEYVRRNQLIDKQLDMFQLRSIFLRGENFFFKYFSGTVYALNGIVEANDDLYVPSITYIKGEFRFQWYSGWNDFSKPDSFLSF